VRSAAEMERVRDVALALHRGGACERCALLTVLCQICRDTIGECVIARQIASLPVKDQG
jgi:hypothetical protein